MVEEVDSGSSVLRSSSIPGMTIGDQAVTRVNRVTSVGLSCADPLAGIRALFDISSRLLAQSLPYARALKLLI